MKRRLFNAIAVVSAVLCAASLILCMQSYLSPYFGENLGAKIGRNGGIEGDWGWAVSSAYGDLVVCPENGGPMWHISYWLAWSIFGFLAIARYVPYVAVRSRRRESGYCRECGYDLRASKERCPECGTAIPAGGGEAK